MCSILTECVVCVVYCWSVLCVQYTDGVCRVCSILMECVVCVVY